MEKRNKSLPGIMLIGASWLTLTLASWFSAPKEISFSERRKLEQFPGITWDSVLSGEFMEGFEKYTLDQFPLRDTFRTVKAMNAFYIFFQKDNNDIYIADGYAAKLEYPLKEDSIRSAAQKFTYIYERYMKGKDNKIFLSLVPDKGYFLAEKNSYPSMDYDRLFSIMETNMPFAQYVDITEALKLSDYYKTDTHWRQEEILDGANTLADALGIERSGLEDYTKMKADIPFYGVYYGQSALPLKSEPLYYLTNETLEGAIVYNEETEKESKIYDMNKLGSRDPYEIFLSGAAALLYIENPKATTDRELIVLRDSFGSSIVPLLVHGYKKITLVDIRYIQSDIIGDYINFDNQDVLFLYSTPILNNSSSLK